MVRYLDCHITHISFQMQLVKCELVFDFLFTISPGNEFWFQLTGNKRSVRMNFQKWKSFQIKTRDQRKVEKWLWVPRGTSSKIGVLVLNELQDAMRMIEENRTVTRRTPAHVDMPSTGIFALELFLQNFNDTVYIKCHSLNSRKCQTYIVDGCMKKNWSS